MSNVGRCPVCEHFIDPDEVEEVPDDEIITCMDSDNILHAFCMDCALQPRDSEACKEEREKQGWTQRTAKEIFG